MHRFGTYNLVLDIHLTLKIEVIYNIQEAILLINKLMNSCIRVVFEVNIIIMLTQYDLNLIPHMKSLYLILWEFIYI